MSRNSAQTPIQQLKRIELKELPTQLPDFKNSSLSKDNLIKQWLTNWITVGLASGKLKHNQPMPKKSDLAYYLSVSVGTIQNAIRYIEDKGFLKSKQKIGTIIAGDDEVETIEMRKLTSKREKVILELKKYIVCNNLSIGAKLPSSRTLASEVKSSTNTTRLALENLADTGVIESVENSAFDSSFVVKQIPQIDENEMNSHIEIKSSTLVEQIEKELKIHIVESYKVGEKLKPHNELAQILSVSIKTVHDAIKSLNKQGILLSRRGKYGTTVIKIPTNSSFEPKPEHSIFASAQDAAFYSYQKVESNIKLFIKDNYEIGDKLPSMEELSSKFDVSTNTIRRALQNLEQQKLITFVRGRYGGTFITNIPEVDSEHAFKWLAVSPTYSVDYSTFNS